MSYLKYLSMPEADRKKYRPPLYTIKWWDHDEAALLPRHSWFGRLTQSLNLSATLKLDLGMFKLEAASPSAAMTSQDMLRTISGIMAKAEPVTVDQLLRRWSDAIQGPVYEPSLIVIDGQLSMMLSAEKLEELVRSLARKTGGGEVNLEQGKGSAPHTFDLLRDIAGKSAGKYLAEWAQDPLNLIQTRIRGHELIVGLMKDREELGQGLEIRVGVPSSALSHFDEPLGFGARIIGWLEHERAGKPLVWGIAVAAADILTAPTPPATA